MSLKVIYVDDEPVLCQMFEDNFGILDDIEIKTFVDPEIALQAIQANPPDLVFLDYRLSNTTGFEVALRIKEQLPIAMITGDLSIDLRPPFVKIFPKPFDFPEMEAFIQGYVARKQSRSE